MKNERFKRLFRFGATIGITLYQLFWFYEFWVRYYNPRMDQPFALRGNWLVCGLYLIVLMLFTNIYGGFKIGYQKPGSLTLSQSISLAGTNVFAVLLTILLGRNQIFDGNLTEFGLRRNFVTKTYGVIENSKP